MALWGAGEPWAEVSCWGQAVALPFVGAGSSVGRAGPLGWRRWRLGGIARCCWVLGGGGKRPPSMDLPRRGVAPAELGAAVVVASGTGPVVVGVVVLGRGGLGGA